MRTQFRYASESFYRSVITALGLTAIVSFLVWLFARLFGLSNADTVTTISGAVFFAFCSAGMIWRYVRNEPVVAIRPDGLLDRRHGMQAVPWEEIKELRLTRAENDFGIAVHLWPRRQAESAGKPAFVIDLHPLDADPGTVLLALSRYKIVEEERL
ncbi:MAG: STM3941 family protein [Rhizobiaceae bacterium]